jgi:tRNA threonylcarbamoyladenosine biosynthesis protein TsaE
MAYFQSEVQKVLTDLQQRSAPHFVFLEGDLGAGKTTFCQELIGALGGNSGDVKSPTFLKLLEYELPQGLCLHIDAYRMSEIAELEKLSLEHYADREPFLWLVEWPQLFGEYLKSNAALARMIALSEVYKLKIECVGEKRILRGNWTSL